uniref:Lipoprotein n=1 Tax=viral metagenome TaxID=1070528 RepID=A0A6M3MG09_9ZZZZ
MRRLVAVCAALMLAGCEDPNAVPVYGKDSGLPANCRAFVQYAVDEYHQGKYTADATFASIERNCGVTGSLWAHKPER